MTWTDCNTGQTFIVDSRTGNSRPRPKAPPWDRGNDPRHDGDRRTLSHRTNEDAKGDKENLPGWLQDALKVRCILSTGLPIRNFNAKENQVYEPTETVVPSLKNPSNPSTFNASLSTRVFEASGQNPLTPPHGCSADSSVTSRFHKDALRRARVVNQVDRKFIACLFETCRTTDDGGREDSPQGGDLDGTLVLIDQHAADERIRVERFLKEICMGFLNFHDDAGNPSQEGVSLRKLSPPSLVLLTVREAQRLAESVEIQEAFNHWGFFFEMPSLEDSDLHGDDNGGYAQVTVQSIPDIVADKVRRLYRFGHFQHLRCST